MTRSLLLGVIGLFVSLSGLAAPQVIPSTSDPANLRLVWDIAPRQTQRPTESAMPACEHSIVRAAFAGFVDQEIWPTMIAGQSYPVTVTFRNTGDNTWLTSDGITMTQSDESAGTPWGVVGVPVPTSVLSDDEVTFTLSIVAPTTPGSYPLSFQLHKNGIAFGAVSAPITVVVQ